MHRFRSVLLLSFLALFLPRVLLAGEGWPQETSDLRPDPKIVFGQLENGVRYVLMPNAEPRDRASLRLWVGAGSLQETEEQRGLAHFLEHMAFNGTTHFPPGTIVEYFQRLGMSFGGDTNAHTSFDRTVYDIDLPEVGSAALAEGLRVLRDYADGMSLLPEEIERERGIILSEKRARDSVEWRTTVAEFEFLLGGTLFPKRFPIGTEEVIRTADRARFQAYYDAWYRPDNLAVIVVGQIDPAAVERQIGEAFSTLQSRAAAPPALALGKLESRSGVFASFHREPEASAARVSVQTIEPMEKRADTAAERLRLLPRALAIAMVNRRLEILAKQEGAPFTAGYVSVAEAFDFFRNASIELVCKPAQWREALAVAEQELRRALEHGFQPAELQEVVANQRNALEQAVHTASTRKNNALAAEIVASLNGGDVLTPPSDELALYRPALETATVEACAAAFREAWKPEGRYLFATGNLDLPADAGTELLAAYQQSQSVAVVAPEAMAEATFAYVEFGPPGESVSRRHVEDLDLWLVEFANGVRVNVKKTPFEAGKIRASLRLGGGRLTEPRDRPGVAYLSELTFGAGGLGRHSADDLERVLAGKTVGFSYRVADDAFVFSAQTNAADLELQLQLFAAYLTEPGYRPEALRQATKTIEQVYTRLKHVPQGPLVLEVQRHLAGGDTRLGLPLSADAQARTLDDVRSWLAPALREGALELAIVGDLELEATLAAVARTLGALPPRRPKPAYDELRRLGPPPAPAALSYTIDSQIPKGLAVLFWPAEDAREVRRSRRLGVLADILDDRLRQELREKIGGTYSPSVGADLSDTFTGYGHLVAQIDVEPAKAEAIVAAVRAVADQLAEQGVTEDELERAKRPRLTSLTESARTNAYWLGSVLASAQEFPQRLDWSRTRLEDNRVITKAEIDALARLYLPAARATQVIVLPKSEPGK